MTDAVGGRKFIYAILVIILSFGLVMMNKLTSVDFNNFAVMIGGIYVAGNVANVAVSSQVKKDSQQVG